MCGHYERFCCLLECDAMQFGIYQRSGVTWSYTIGVELEDGDKDI